MFYNQLSWDGFYRINRLIVTSGSGSESNRHYYDFEDRGGVTDIFTGSLGIQQDFGWMSYDVGVSHNQSLTDNPNEHTWRFVQEAEALLRTDFPPDSNAQVILKYANVDTGLTRTAEVYTYDTKREEKETGLQFNLKFPLSLNKYFNGYMGSINRVACLSTVCL